LEAVLSKFHVTLARSITTVIEVEAKTSEDARQQIKKYGIVEAISDFQPLAETMTSRIMKVEKQ
jgi:hypothetical protein